MKARVIHLERHTERKKRCEANLRRLKQLTITWIDAVDARNLSISDVGAFGVKTTTAIRQSHMKCWRDFLQKDEKEEYCLILEDDARLDMNFESILFEKMRDLEEKKEVWDLLYCGHFEVTSDGSMTWFWHMLGMLTELGHQPYDTVHTGVVQPRFVLGTHAYVISKKCARQCLDYFEKRSSYNVGSLHVDVGLQLIPDIRFLAIVPPIATQAPCSETSSFGEQRYFPKFVNTQLDRIRNPYGLSYAYMMTVPLGGLYGYIINGWTIVLVLILTIASCISLYIMNRVPWGWFLLFFSFVYIIDSIFYNYIIEKKVTF